MNLTVTDQGKGFDFTNIPDPTSPDNVEKVNGRGVFLMVKLSDEIDFVENGRIVKCLSINIGAVRLTERFITHHPVPESELEGLRSYIKERLTEEVPLLTGALIGVGGTVTVLGAIDMGLIKYDPVKVHGHKFQRSRLYELVRLLACMTVEERESIPLITPGRSDVIVTGGTILLGIMDRADAGDLIVSDDDYLKGMIIRYSGLKQGQGNQV